MTVEPVFPLVKDIETLVVSLVLQGHRMPQLPVDSPVQDRLVTL